MKTVGELCYEKLVYLQGHIGAEEAGDTKGGDHVAYDQHDPAQPRGIKVCKAQNPQKEVQRVTVYNGNGERKKIAPVEPANNDAECDKENALQNIFYHAYTETAPKRLDGIKYDEGGGGNHRDTEICLAANGNSQCYKDDSKQPEQF